MDGDKVAVNAAMPVEECESLVAASPGDRVLATSFAGKVVVVP